MRGPTNFTDRRTLSGTRYSSESWTFSERGDEGHHPNRHSVFHDTRPLLCLCHLPKALDVGRLALTSLPGPRAPAPLTSRAPGGEEFPARAEVSASVPTGAKRRMELNGSWVFSS